RRRVVQQLAEPFPVEYREELARPRCPAEREVTRDLCERSAKRPPVVDLGHCARRLPAWVSVFQLMSPPLQTRARETRARRGRHRKRCRPEQALLPFAYPDSFERQLGDRVTKRLKSPRARAPG